MCLAVAPECLGVIVVFSVEKCVFIIGQCPVKNISSSKKIRALQMGSKAHSDDDFLKSGCNDFC
jgi:hypothetical protein